MARTTASDISPREIKETLLRHKKKVVALFAILVGLTLAFIAMEKPHYRYEAKLFLRLGRENVVLDPTVTTSSTQSLSMPNSREDEMNSTVDLLTSRILIENLVDELGPPFILGSSDEPGNPIVEKLREIKNKIDPRAKTSEREKAIRTVSKGLDVEAVKHSTVIGIGYSDESPDVAMKVVQTMISLYQREHIRINRAPRSYDFLSSQAESAKKQLEETESLWRQLKNETGIVNVNDQKTLMVTSLDSLELELKRERIELSASEASKKSLEEQLQTVPAMRQVSKTDGQLAAGADHMKEALYQLQVKEKELSARYTDDHYLVRAIRDQVNEAKGLYDSETIQRSESVTATNRVYEELESSLAQTRSKIDAHNAKIVALQEQIAAMHREMANLNDVELKFVELQRLVELQNTNYRKYSENLEQARIDQELDLQRISSINVVESNAPPTDPTESNVLMKLAVGCFASLMASLSLAFVAERWRKSFSNSNPPEERLILAPSASATLN